jgi:hypothetical protein
MATWNAIAATSKALLAVLEDGFPRERFPISPTFQLVQPPRLAGSEPLVDGISLCLWRVAVNPRRALPPRRTPDGRRMKPSLPLDLHYLLLPVASAADTQQRLFGWALRELEDHPVLASGELNRQLAEPAVFAPDEAVELVADPLALADFLALWDKAKATLPLAMGYTARMLLIDSEIGLSEGPPVREREFLMAGVQR